MIIHTSFSSKSSTTDVTNMIWILSSDRIILKSYMTDYITLAKIFNTANATI